MRRRSLLSRLLWGWSIILLLAYFGRIDPVYHHSRYLLSALPPLLILAAAGAAPALHSPRRMLTQFVFVMLLIATPISISRTTAIYQGDVSGINCAEVETGEWLHAHLPPGTVIATHDGGAIGFFSDHQIIDISGLINPELIPFLHDPDRLETYLKSQHVGYIAIYRDWFSPDSSLMQDLQGKAIYSACGGGYFQVYKTGWT